MSDRKLKTLKPYFQENSFILYHGDCLKILDLIDENTIDMIFADPPYNLSNDGFSVHAGKRVSVNKGEWDKSKGVESDFHFHLDWIEGCRRILKPSGTIWISGTYHSIYQCGYALQKLNFKILNDISWYKPNASPNLSCRYFAASHESLIWARKGEKAKHTFNYKDMKHGKWLGDMFKNPDKQMRSAWGIPESEDFWTISTPKPNEKLHGKHPTQKPIALLNRIILASTNKDDLVLDPFTGSSTTGLVAHKHGRNFIGIDTEIKYLDLSIKRYNDLVKGVEYELL